MYVRNDLVKFLAKTDFTLKDISYMTGYSLYRVRKFFSPSFKKIPVDFLIACSKIFGVPIDDFIVEVKEYEYETSDDETCERSQDF